MAKKQAGNKVTGKYLEHSCYEIAREVYETIDRSIPSQFTYPSIDLWWSDLNTVVYEMDRLPEATFKELIGVIAALTEARNELRLARFLFNVEEINPLYRLIMRTRAVSRGKHILQKVLWHWPLRTSS